MIFPPITDWGNASPAPPASVSHGDAGRFRHIGDYAAMRQRTMPGLRDLRAVDHAWISPAGGSFDWTRTAWTGAFPEHSDIPVRIEAAAYHGRPVRFIILMPWNHPWMMQAFEASTGEIAVWGSGRVASFAVTGFPVDFVYPKEGAVTLLPAAWL